MTVATQYVWGGESTNFNGWTFSESGTAYSHSQATANPRSGSRHARFTFTTGLGGVSGLSIGQFGFNGNGGGPAKDLLSGSAVGGCEVVFGVSTDISTAQTNLCKILAIGDGSTDYIIVNLNVSGSSRRVNIQTALSNVDVATGLAASTYYVIRVRAWTVDAAGHGVVLCQVYSDNMATLHGNYTIPITLAAGISLRFIRPGITPQVANNSFWNEASTWNVDLDDFWVAQLTAGASDVPSQIGGAVVGPYRPNANGSIVEWFDETTGTAGSSSFNNIDEEPSDATDYNYSPADATLYRDLFDIPNYAGADDILAAMATYRTRTHDTSGVNDVFYRPCYDKGGGITNFDDDFSAAGTTERDDYRALDLNTSEFNALEVGARKRSNLASINNKRLLNLFVEALEDNGAAPTTPVFTPVYTQNNYG